MIARGWIVVLAAAGWLQQGSPAPGVLKVEFIYDSAPFPQCHASTLAETPDGIVAAWFGGTRERHPDVGIWASRHQSGSWTEPVEIATGESDSGRYPCWNPVLFQPRAGPLLLFYKAGPSPSTWWGLLRTSGDGGTTWSGARRLPQGLLGPIKNKPIQLADGTLLCPSSTEHDGWRIHFERTADLGGSWEKTGAVNDVRSIAAIQPSILTLRDGNLLALCRTRQGKIGATESSDGGRSWGNMFLTELPNPNSGVDAVTLSDGRHLLVYNHSPRSRSPLNVAVSPDGKKWNAALVLESEPGEYSYPAVIQAKDGLVHITYTWRRVRIRHVVIDPGRLELSDIREGAWPN